MDDRNLVKFLAIEPQSAIPESSQPKLKAINTIGSTAYVPSLPLHIVLKIVESKAGKALPLVLAIHRQLHMAKRDSTPLNAAVWKAAGSPSTREKERIIAKLKGLPNVIVLEKARTTTSHYRVRRGSDWVDNKTSQ
jgi:hypothetical protein